MISLEELLDKKEPYELFTRDMYKNKELRSKLIKQFHPDVHGGDRRYEEAIIKINKLFGLAGDAIQLGIWKEPGMLFLTGDDGRQHEMRYTRWDSFELGTRYVGRETILYLLDEEHKELAERMKEQLEEIRFADESMRKEFQKYLPKVIATFTVESGQNAIVIHKEKGLYTVNEILSYFGGKMDARSVAWILSSLYNLLCFLEFNHMNHNGITLLNYYISPKEHYGALLGGWWYATKEGGSLYGVPEEIYKLMTPEAVREGRSSNELDLEAIHLMGRTLLGDESGINLAYDKSIPRALADWVRGPALINAFEEYKRWNEVLYDSFGRRSFYDMKVDIEELEEKLGGN